MLAAILMVFIVPFIPMGTMRKTHLQMFVGLNPLRFMEYLERLLQHDLVTIVKDEEGV